MMVVEGMVVVVLVVAKGVFGDVVCGRVETR